MSKKIIQKKVSKRSLKSGRRFNKSKRSLKGG